MTNNVAFPSFRPQDLSDEFWFIGRLKEATLEEKTFEGKDEPFTVYSIRAVYERLDAEQVTTRYSFFRVPTQGKISPGSPLGRMIIAMDTAGTPIDFDGASGLDGLQAALNKLLNTVYVCVQKSVMERAGKEPGRFVFPVAKIGEGNNYDATEGQRIIKEGREVSAAGATAAPKGNAVTATVVPTSADVSEPSTPKISVDEAIAELLPTLAGKPVPEAATAAMAWASSNAGRVNEPGALIAAVRSPSFFEEAATRGSIAIIDGTVQSA